MTLRPSRAPPCIANSAGAFVMPQVVDWGQKGFSYNRQAPDYSIMPYKCSAVRVNDKEAYSSLCYKHHTATGTRIPYEITQPGIALKCQCCCQTKFLFTGCYFVTFISFVHSHILCVFLLFHCIVCMCVCHMF